MYEGSGDRGKWWLTLYIVVLFIIRVLLGPSINIIVAVYLNYLLMESTVYSLYRLVDILLIIINVT